MKILSIGNSFSQDATRYLHRMAKVAGIDIETVNLYIGGCPLRTHYINAIEDIHNYELEFNGQKTGFRVSIKQALISGDYDVVTLQQASNASFRPESFEPYSTYLKGYIAKYCPKAKLYIHETWGYKEESERLAAYKFTSHAEMYAAVEKAYIELYGIVDAVGMLPSGKAIMTLHEMGFCKEDTHRDDIHVSLGLGRFTQALTWLSYLTGYDPELCEFDELDVPMTDEQRKAAKIAAKTACDWAQQFKK